IVTAEPSTTQPGKQNVTVVHRTGHTTEIQQFNNVQNGKIPQHIVIRKTTHARVYEIVSGPKQVPVISAMPKVHTSISGMSKFAPIPKANSHVPAIPAIPAVAVAPNSEQIRVQIDRAMKSVDVATIASTAATTATQRALKAVQVARVHPHHRTIDLDTNLL